MKLPKGIPKILVFAFIAVFTIFILELTYLIWREPLIFFGLFTKPNVIAVSDLAGFEIKPSDEPALLEYLNKLRIFEEKKVKKVTVHLTNKLQFGRRYGDSQGIMVASDFKIEGPVLHLYIYLRQNILDKPEKVRSSFFNAEILVALDNLVNGTGSNQVVSGRLPEEVLQRFKESNGDNLTKPYLLVKK